MVTQAYGHQWKDPARVQEFVHQTDREAAESREVWDLLIALLPFERRASLSVLDIGSGHGVLAAAILDAFPNAKTVGLDLSEPMMEEGGKRMARFGDRFRYHVGDFAGGTLPADLKGPFDLVVSSRAIHHVPSEAKRTLYADVFRHLNPGGCFFNLDNMRPRDEVLRDRYLMIRDPKRAAERQAARAQGQRTGGGREHSDPVEEQLPLLHEAGFNHVDCVYKKLDRAMIGGYK